MNSDSQSPEFSRTVVADRIRDDEVTEIIEASPAERGALAERFELEAIDRLIATVRLKRVRGGQMIRVLGTLDADVVQTCVVTLEPVRNHVADQFEALFAPPHLVPDESSEIDVDLEEDLPESLQNGRIDIGELTAQHLSLALDPYLRCPGIEFESQTEGEAPPEAKVDPEPVRENPFASLAKIKRSH